MQQPRLGKLVVEWKTGKETVDFQFNPSELSFQKGVQIAEIAIPGLDTPVLQFVRGQNETLTLDLFFDTTDEAGIGGKPASVLKKTDLIYQLVKVEPSTHAPPICQFEWNDEFPGSGVSDHVGNQKRNAFRCIVETVRHKYTQFTDQGVPQRATLNVTLREYKSLGDQLAQLGLNSPDKTQIRVLRSDETLSAIAEDHYLHAAEWRRIADANGLEDPRRLTPGVFLKLPPIL
jgi:hypothetical protein